MYHIAICDDNENYIVYLEKLLMGRVFSDSEDIRFYRYRSGEELDRDLYKNIPFDLLILDMQMKSLDGDETAKRFRKMYPYALLIFCSGVCLPSVKSFETNAYRFLLKEYDSDKMTNELKNIITEMKKNSYTPKLAVSYRSNTEYILIRDVLHVSIRKHGCIITTFDKLTQKTQTYICNRRIEAVFEDLKNWGFAYAHNSYFVNLSYVVRIANHELELEDGTILSISRSKENLFREELATFLASRY